MKTRISTILKMFTLCLILLHTDLLFGTEDPEKDYSSGFGATYTNDTSSGAAPEIMLKFGIGFDFVNYVNYGMDISFKAGNADIAFMMRYYSELVNWVLGELEPQEKAFFLGFTVGSKSVKNSSYFYPSIGIGYISGVQRGEYLSSDLLIFGNKYYEKKNISGIAVPLAIDMGVDFGGVGLSLMNEYIISMDKSYYNCSLNLCLFMN